MGHSIAVMNTKGGVGKSTVVMALAETLSAFHRKNVLVIDSDSQTSISTMLMATDRWEETERQGRTLVDYLIATVLPEHGPAKASWHEYVVTGVSDVEEARSVHLIPCHMELTLFERMVSSEKRERELRASVRALLSEAKRLYDIVLIDCPPGLSVLTESWLREVDYLMPPLSPGELLFGLTMGGVTRGVLVGAVVWLGMPDPVSDNAELNADGQGYELVVQALAQIYGARPFTARQLFDMHANRDGRAMDVVGALCELTKSVEPRSSAKLGRMLGAIVGREVVTSGRSVHLEKLGAVNGVVRYYVQGLDINTTGSGSAQEARSGAGGGSGTGSGSARS